MKGGGGSSGPTPFNQGVVQLSKVQCSSVQCCVAQKDSALLSRGSVVQKGAASVGCSCRGGGGVAQQGVLQLSRVQRSSVGCGIVQKGALRSLVEYRASQQGAVQLRGCSVTTRVQRNSKNDAVKLERVGGSSVGSSIQLNSRLQTAEQINRGAAQVRRVQNSSVGCSYLIRVQGSSADSALACLSQGASICAPIYQRRNNYI